MKFKILTRLENKWTKTVYFAHAISGYQSLNTSQRSSSYVQFSFMMD